MALSAENAPAIEVAKPKKARDPKDSKPKKLRSHPSYFEMIGDAIGVLKERNGSSQYAISKLIEEKHKDDLPPNFKKMLLYHLKKLVAAGKLVKIKNSFKISAVQTLSAKEKPSPSSAAAKLKPVASEKPKAVAAKRKAAAADKKKQRPAKSSKVSAQASPAKKKKATSAKPVKAKKPKSVKSPAKKAAASKKMKRASK